MSFLDTHTSGLIKPKTGVNNPTGLPAPDSSAQKMEFPGTNRDNTPQKTNIASLMMGSNVSGGQQTGKPSGSFHAANSGRTDDESEEEGLLPFGSFMTRHTPLRWNGNANAQQEMGFSTLNFMS